MALYRRGSIWWVRFTTPDGRRIRASAGTQDRVAAQEYHDRLRTECWRVYRLGTKPRRSWQEAVLRWLDETTHKASRRDDLAQFKWLDPYLRGRHLDELTRDLISDIARKRRAEGVANASVNQTVQVIRAILRKAHREWEWIDSVPAIHFLPLPRRRVRWLTREDAECLLSELPEHLAEMVRFSLATGLRQANVTGMEWTQIDLSRRMAWVHPDQAKARKAIPVPLNADAMLVLRRQQGRHSTRVFTYKGQPVLKPNGHAWRLALKRANIQDFRWHDLRHTWASWHVQSGTPVHVLQELGGWSDIRMVQKYAHMSADHLAEYADRMARPRIVGTILAQSEDVAEGKTAQCDT